ncbi:hypothetical protein [Cerasicoccus maritimus]|uniref:hypothetical protein n=1 Tax=Cerasicoccus maritimus TaxID=490089 RepID=UPI00285285E4|nr:hypothetical protein [Cerasicoccus maritimus]
MPKPHPYDWLIEPIAEDPSFVRKPMFGAVGCYLRGKMVCVLAAREKPWRGLLITVEQSEQRSILSDYPQLTPHEVLPKWLYLPEEHDDFEPVAEAVIEAIRQGDPRFGVIPPPRKRKAKNAARRRPL